MARPVRVTQLPLAGRASDLEMLEADLAGAREGGGGCVLLVADPGIGKTRLVGELLRRYESDVASLTARAFPLGATASLAVWVEALDRHLRDLDPGRVMALCGPFGPDLAVILSSVAAAGEVVHAAQPSQTRLVEAFGHVLDHLSLERAVVVFLDDAHLADGSSWQALAYLARRLEHRPVLFVLAARPAELAEVAEAAEVLSGLDQDGLLRQHPLAPLDAAGLRGLAEAVVGGPVPDVLVEWLSARSGGNSLFAVGLVRALLEEGADLQQPRLASVPEDLGLRVQARLRSLEEPSLATLEVLAVVGARIPIGDLVVLAGRPLERLAEILEPLVRGRLITEQEIGRDLLYEIAHPLVAEVIYGRIGAARRQALHRRVARGLVELGRLGAAAPHFLRSSSAGDAEAIAALHDALQQSEQRELHRESLALLEALVELLPAGDERWLEIFDAMVRQADWVVEHRADVDVTMAIRALRIIEQLLEGRGDDARLGTVKFHLANLLAWGAKEVAAATALAQEAHVLFTRCGDTHAALLVDNELGYLAAIGGNVAEHVRVARNVRARADAMGDDVASLQAACSLAIGLEVSGKTVEAFEATAEALELARRVGSTYRLTYMLVLQSVCRAEAGWSGDATPYIEAAIAASPAYGETLLREQVVGLSWRLGDLAAGCRWTDEAMAAHPDHLSPRRSLGAIWGGLCFAEAGDLDRAQRLASRAAAVFNGRPWWAFEDLARWAAATVQALTGDLDGAIDGLTAAVAGLARIGHLSGAADACASLCELAGWRHAPIDGLDATIDAMEAAFESEPLRALARFSRGCLEVAAGTVDDDVVAGLVEARTVHQAAGWKLYAARTDAVLGGALEGHDRVAAVEHWRRAADGFEHCGAVVRRDLALDAMDRLGTRGRRARRGVFGPGALSARERDVVRLTVEGLTARAIGERLHLGRRTVETHLASVYAKLGVRSKVELVRVAPTLDL